MNRNWEPAGKPILGLEIKSHLTKFMDATFKSHFDSNYVPINQSRAAKKPLTFKQCIFCYTPFNIVWWMEFRKQLTTIMPCWVVGEISCYLVIGEFKLILGGDILWFWDNKSSIVPTVNYNQQANRNKEMSNTQLILASTYSFSHHTSETNHTAFFLVSNQVWGTWSSPTLYVTKHHTPLD